MSANLSVGIKTDQARQSLRELKAFMVSEMKGVTLGINTAGVVNALDAALQAKKFTISIDRAALTASVKSSLAEAFSGTYAVKLDLGGLTAQVKAAVGAGMAGTLGGGGAPAAAGGLNPDIQVRIAQMLAPAVDELAKAASLVGANARRFADSGGTPQRKQTASSGYSYKNPDTGESISYKQTIDPSGIKDQLQAAFRQTKAEREQEKANAYGATYGPNRKTLDAGIKAREVADAAEAAQVQADSNRTLAFRRRYAQSEATEAERAAREVQADTNRTLAMRRNWARAEETQVAAQARELQSDNDRTFRMRSNYAKSQAAAEARQMREDQADSTRTLQMRRSFRASEDKALREQMSNVYNAAKFQASTVYNARGSTIAGASALKDQFGEQAASKFVNNRAVMDSIGMLEQYRLKTVQVKDSHEMLQRSMNDLQSGVRGLAGSVGALWTTWGSTVPLVAMAAVGMAMRATLEVGKELQYQLAFVSALSDGTSVSMKAFGDAVRGSMVAPVQAAEAMRGLAQNGLSVQQSLSALPTILQLATVGEMSLSQAALGATGVMAAFNLQVSDLGRISDVFAKAAASSNTSVQSMVDSMRLASTVSDQYHVTLEETAASLMVLAQRNITGTSAGTAFRSMMTELATPTKKAQGAFKELGIELYTGDKQLKDYGTSLKMLRDRTALLNEQGRLTFLNDVFGERGAKAINAILSDFGAYEEALKTVTEKSKDFTAQVNAALGETTEGRIKALMSEFQLATASAFNDSATGVNNFIDSLRRAAGSTEFQTFLRTTMGLVTGLSSFLVDHAALVATTIAAWAGVRILGPMVASAFALIRTEMRATQVAAEATAIAGKSMWASLTGGLSLVIGLAAEFLILRDNTSEAEKASKAFSNAIESQSAALDRSIERGQQDNLILARKIELMKGGATAAKAQQEAEASLLGDQANKAKSEITRIQAELADELKKPAYTIVVGDENNLSGRAAPASKDVRSQARIDNLQKLLADQKALEDKYNTQRTIDAVASEGNEKARRLEVIRTFNDRVKLFAEKGRQVDGLQINDNVKRTKDEFDKYVRESQAALDKKGDSYTTPHPDKKDTQGHKDDIAEARAMLEALHAEEAQTRANITFREQLDKARYSSGLFGTYLSNVLAEQRAIQGSNELIKLQETELRKLNEMKALPRLQSQSDQTNLTTEIKRRTDQLNLDKQALENKKQLVAVTAEIQRREADSKDTKELATLATKDQKRLNDIVQSFSTKAVDPATAAAMKAVADVQNEYAQAAVAHQEQLAQARASEVILLAQRSAMVADFAHIDIDEVARQDQRIVAVRENVALEEAKLATMKAQSTAAATTAEIVARQQTERSNTAEYGFNKFWENYQASAESAAKNVEDIMKTSTDGMTGMVEKFATTGKLSFGSFAASVLAQATKMMASRALTSLLQMGMSFLGPSSAGSYGAQAATDNGLLMQFGGYVPSANGNVVGPRGAMALSRQTGSAGITNRPLTSLIGEGDKPEAYVPLNDGRTIPVTVSGAGGGGNVTTSSVTVHLHQDGSSTVSSDVSGQQASQLGEMIRTATMGVIVEQQRAGGLLYTG